MVNNIDLKLPKHWNQCSVKQLELIADIMREQIEKQNRFHPFSMRNVKIASFFAFTGIEIVNGPNPRIPVEEQHFICRMRRKSIYPFNRDVFSIYLWQINYWLTSKSKTRDTKSAEYISSGCGLLDWLDNDNNMYLTKFPYPLIKRRHSIFLYHRFKGPNADLDGFSWAQYRFASDTMNSYTQLSNSFLRMQQMKSFSVRQLQKQAKNIDLAKSMFLATIFNAKTKYIDSNTGMIKHGYHYESNQCSDNAHYFRNFPDTQWQVILFWWTGIMHTLSKRFPHVFKVQNIKNKKPNTPIEIYTATTATMQKHVGITEDEVNHQSYSLVLEHLERIAKENEELERIRSKK